MAMIVSERLVDFEPSENTISPGFEGSKKCQKRRSGIVAG
jgi:hypothetical protein